MGKIIDTKDLDKVFDDLVSKDKLNINTIEEIMLKDIENYKKELISHIEELLVTKIDEKKLIRKKRRMASKRIKTKK